MLPIETYFQLEKTEIVLCPVCEGSGFHYGEKSKPCKNCNSTGRIINSHYYLKFPDFNTPYKTKEELTELFKRDRINIDNSLIDTKFKLCKECKGKGYVDGKLVYTNKEVHCEKVACSVCNGKGRYRIYSVIESIPYNWFEEPEEN